MTEGARDELLVRLDEKVGHIHEKLPLLQTKNGCKAARAELRNDLSGAALSLLRARVWTVVSLLVAAGIGWLVSRV